MIWHEVWKLMIHANNMRWDETTMSPGNIQATTTTPMWRHCRYPEHPMTWYSGYNSRCNNRCLQQQQTLNVHTQGQQLQVHFPNEQGNDEYLCMTSQIPPSTNSNAVADYRGNACNNAKNSPNVGGMFKNLQNN